MMIVHCKVLTVSVFAGVGRKSGKPFRAVKLTGVCGDDHIVATVFGEAIFEVGKVYDLSVRSLFYNREFGAYSLTAGAD